MTARKARDLVPQHDHALYVVSADPETGEALLFACSALRRCIVTFTTKEAANHVTRRTTRVPPGPSPSREGDVPALLPGLATGQPQGRDGPAA